MAERSRGDESVTHRHLDAIALRPGCDLSPQSGNVEIDWQDLVGILLLEHGHPGGKFALAVARWKQCDALGKLSERYDTQKDLVWCRVIRQTRAFADFLAVDEFQTTRTYRAPPSPVHLAHRSGVSRQIEVGEVWPR